MNIRISDDVVFRDLAGEAVILNLSSGVYFGLDEVGTRMWQLLSEHGDDTKALALLLDEYEVDAEQLRQDFDQLIGQLRAKGLILVEP
jgi:hypothetical protein